MGLSFSSVYAQFEAQFILASDFCYFCYSKAIECKHGQFIGIPMDLFVCLWRGCRVARRWKTLTIFSFTRESNAKFFSIHSTSGINFYYIGE